MKKPTRVATEEIVEAATIPKKWRPFAACVCDRESVDLGQGAVRSEARNPNSSASGRWQFLNRNGTTQFCTWWQPN